MISKNFFGKEKIGDFFRNLLVAVLGTVLAVGAANLYEDKRLDRLYDETTFRYFDLISRILDIDPNNNSKKISNRPEKKDVYFAGLESIGDDVKHIRQNKIFKLEQRKFNELVTLHTVIVQAIALEKRDKLYQNNILMVMEKFCKRYTERMEDPADLERIRRKVRKERTEREVVMDNAQLICDANFSVEETVQK